MRQIKIVSIICLLGLLLFGLNGCIFSNKDPEATITAKPLSGNAPLEVSFDASKSNDPDGEIEEYLWNFGDGSRGRGEKVTHTFQGKGEYTVELTVADNHGSETSSKIDITVTNTPPTLKILSTPSSLEGTAPFEVKLDLSQSDDPDGTIEKYSVDFGDGETKQGTDILDNITHTYSQAGTYSLTVSITDNSGATSSVSNEVTITEKKEDVQPVSEINLSPTSGRVPLEVTVDGTGSRDPDGEIKQYIWKFGEEETLRGVKAQHTFNSPGEYQIKLTVVDDKGNQSTSTETVSVSSPIYEVGQTGNNGSFELTLEEVTVREQIGGESPESRNQYYVLDLKIKSLSDDQYLSKFLYFSCRDSRGETHNVSMATAYLNDYLTNNALDENQTRTGKLAFELPKLADHYILVFSPPGQPKLEFKFS